ncbi:MAG: DUF3990 domain-containing protein [Hespellia sp.]|nr:DUF3990 domain-containing protein [Hespellia sp.]
MDGNKVEIFHGSEEKIRIPQFGVGKNTNDYGRGFYCTQNIELAKEWACSNGYDGYANKYEFDMNGLRVLKLNSPSYSVLNWLAILADNRTYWERSSISENAKNYLHEHFLIDISEFDVIIGYRADDSYFTFAKNFVANGISLHQLQEAMKLGKLGEQIVLKSPKAFDRIRFIDADKAQAELYYERKIARDRMARTEYRKNVRANPQNNGLLMIDIIREGMVDGDPRLL